MPIDRSRSPKIPVIRKILFVRTDRLGDLLMNLPVIHRLKQNHPHATLTLVCHAAWEPLFHHHLDVNRVVGIDSAKVSRGGAERRALLRDLGRERFDCAVVTAPSKEWHWATFRLGIRTRVGFDRKWGFLLTHRTPDRKAVSGRHEVDSNLEAVDGLCPERWNGRMGLGLDLHPRADELLAPLGLAAGKKRIVFHLSSSNPRKEISPAAFAGVISRLLERPRHQVIVVGADAGTGRAAEMLKIFEGEPRFVNLIGRTTVTELALLIKEAQCVVSTDSGPLHLAWVQGVPTVALFVTGVEGSDPRRWGAYPGFATSRTLQAAPDAFDPEAILEAIRQCAPDATEAA